MTGEEPEIDDDRALAAEYALGLLEPTDRSLFEARMLVDADLKAEVEFWQEHLAALASDVAEVKPQDRVKVTLERRLFGVAARDAGFSLLRFLRYGAIAALVALVIVVAWPAPRRADLIATLVDPSRGVRVEATYLTETGELDIARIAGRPEPGLTHELWFIAPGAAPVSLGVLSNVGDTVITLPPEIAASLKGSTLAISEEPPGGSTTGAPTGPVIAAAEVTSA